MEWYWKLLVLSLLVSGACELLLMVVAWFRKDP